MARVLFVEDQPEWRDIIARYLAMAGHDVKQADSVEAALYVLGKKPPCDVLVFDLLLEPAHESLDKRYDHLRSLSALVERLRLKKVRVPPIVVVTSASLTKREVIELFSRYRPVIDYYEKSAFNPRVFSERLGALPASETSHKSPRWRILTAFVVAVMSTLVMWGLMMGVRLIADPQTQQAWLNVVPSAATFSVVLLFILNYDGPLHDLLAAILGRKA